MSSEGESRVTTQETALEEVPSLAVAAHELKAPLALIRQLSLLLKDEPAETPLDDRTVRQYLDRLVLTSEQSLRLVDMLTRQARLDDGLFELEPVHVGRLCEDIAHELMPLCSAMGQTIEVRTPARAPLAVANHELLRSVAFGLCDNALHYSQVKQPITLQVSQRSGIVRLGVRDYGPPLAADVFRRLKQRLGTSAQPISDRPSSSGLGLYVAGRFVRAMNGQLGVIRHRERGATFYVDTPTSSQLSFLSL